MDAIIAPGSTKTAIWLNILESQSKPPTTLLTVSPNAGAATRNAMHAIKKGMISLSLIFKKPTMIPRINNKAITHTLPAVEGIAPNIIAIMTPIRNAQAPTFSVADFADLFSPLVVLFAIFTPLYEIILHYPI